MSAGRSRWVLAPYLLSLALVAGAAGVRELDRAWPPPLDRALPVSVEVSDRNGELLRAFATPAGDWRLDADLDAIDPGFVRMLVAYEDRRFFDHIGVDPLAVARAAWQLVRNGHVVSGGSTITMQLAHLLEGPRPRSLATKLVQMLRALQIETRLTKREILELYLTLAPYGGNLEGTTAAALAYLGKSPAKLTAAEQALLVALPQLPERRRPDRYPQSALAARDRVLDRMVEAKLLDEAEAGQARRQPLKATRRNLPVYAAHLAQQAVALHPGRATHRTTLDRTVQAALETLARERAPALGRLSIAMLLVDHASGEVIAHVGSPGIFDGRRWGEIDMVEAVRSPGSALKPFIYGLAFEDGLVRPETLIEDRPADFSGYRPANFDLTYQGTVTVAQALQLSLNLPAIELLDAVGPQRLMARMGAAKVKALLPADQPPGLAIGLGGIGLTLRDLVTLYAGLANGGSAVALDDGIARGGEAPAPGTLLLDPGASWYVADILSRTAPPPDFASSSLAYKTGTSYGYRDAWAVGFDGRHVLGVWVGRPDGAAVPGLTGLTAAAPLLFEAFDRLPGPRLPMRKSPAGTVNLATAELPLALRHFSRADQRLPAGRSARARPPVIVHPPDGARVDLSEAPRLALKLEGGVAPFRWLANGRPLAGVERRRSLSWAPDSPGASMLTVIDAAGKAASVTIYIE